MRANKLETALSRDRLACLAPPDMVFSHVHVHASHKRSLTHYLSSQGWASGVLGFVCIYVYMLCIEGGGGGCLCYWVGFLSYFVLLFLYSILSAKLMYF